MFRWKLMLRNRLGSHDQQSKARHPRPTVKPQLEELTPRLLPSASSLSADSEASPQATSAAAAITSFVFSMVEQRAEFIATVERDLGNAVLSAVGQVVGLEVSAFEQQVDSFFGIDLGASNEFDSGSDSSSDAIGMALNTQKPAPTNTPPQTGSGSGSNSSGAGHT